MGNITLEEWWQLKENPELMYPAGTKIYDAQGELFGTVLLDIYRLDLITSDQFDLVDKDIPMNSGDPIPDPIWRLSEGEPYKPKEAPDGFGKDH